MIMASLHCFFCIFIALFLSLSFQQGFVAAKGSRCQKLIVDQTGHGNFSTIQSAIDHVPINNRNWFCILVSAGTYREKVKIPREKPFIILKGAGKRKTVVVWNEYNIDNPTFATWAAQIVVKCMSFVNTYNGPKSKNPTAAAAAAAVHGDKTYFYRCGFSSVQDTLWDESGRHYFKRCSIEGAVDFICGAAQSREEKTDANGFVFKNCNVFGTGKALLGRAWRQSARVLFYNCQFADIIDPLGWEAWNGQNQEQLTFAEYGNRGPGADTSKRVEWERKLSAQAVAQFTSMSYIDNEGWLQSLPV
ncbi:Pectinesterase, catalytic [Corchorus capsularis]|uniref:pectinesterase n=1 Tax=Corchorus capsularis TaxID=210143 RepID=A0A1R3JDX1_COCAP|nr:Pectinesterase, catalytic [Corchorus capsularis]